MAGTVCSTNCNNVLEMQSIKAALLLCLGLKEETEGLQAEKEV